MNSYDTAEALIAAISADSVFMAAATALLGRAPVFFVGFDSKNPPTMSSVPFVVAVPNKDTVEDNTHRKHGLLLACVCTDDIVVTASGITRYSGYSRISRLAQLLDTAMMRHYRETPDGLRSLLAWTDVTIDGYHPEYHAMRELTVVMPFVVHLITFQSNGGTAVAAQEVFDARRVTAPVAPTRAGFAFAGWHTDPGLTILYDFGREVTASFTLFARWT
ncbi:MAG: hypothetical protein DDT36_01693 [Firmicutes bacterium]|nr:hypothetical protein [Bacillota bacterium]